jgi:hypothetical protein
MHALAVLVIACPCALGIAMPLAVTAALGRLAERGILVRTGLALAGLPRVRVVAFDKTGTLTEGRPEVKAVVPFATADADALLADAAAVERGSEHALARGIVAARGAGLATPAASDVRVVPGLGVEGRVTDCARDPRGPRRTAGWIQGEGREARWGADAPVLAGTRASECGSRWTASRSAASRSRTACGLGPRGRGRCARTVSRSWCCRATHPTSSRRSRRRWACRRRGPRRPAARGQGRGRAGLAVRQGARGLRRRRAQRRARARRAPTSARRSGRARTSRARRPT